MSDGAVGDLKHSARKSDHNPNDKDYVTAIDITFDTNPADGIGVDCNALAKALWDAGRRDPRIKYLIWNRRITDKTSSSGWKPYHGANAHSHHLHISVSTDSRLYNDAAQWDLSRLDAATPEQTAAETDYVVQAGDSLWKLANENRTTVDALKKLNKLKSDVLKIGQVLKIEVKN